MNTKFIHLLYVPTMACNMQCRYCYLEDHTVDTLRGGDCLETLQYAIAKFREADVVPFNISLHGGEVTTLPEQEFHDLIQYISRYYQTCVNSSRCRLQGGASSHQDESVRTGQTYRDRPGVQRVHIGQPGSASFPA